MIFFFLLCLHNLRHKPLLLKEEKRELSNLGRMSTSWAECQHLRQGLNLISGDKGRGSDSPGLFPWYIQKQSERQIYIKQKPDGPLC